MMDTRTGGKATIGRRAALAALAFAVAAAAPAADRRADGAESDPIFGDGFEISGVSTWSTAVGLPPGVRLDIYQDAFQTLQSTEIIDRVDIDFSGHAINIGAVVSGYVTVPTPGDWQLRLDYSPLGDLSVDGVLIGGYLGNIWWCSLNHGTVESPPEALPTGAILQLHIRYFSGCFTPVWDQTVSLSWRANADDAWYLVPAESLFH